MIELNIKAYEFCLKNIKLNKCDNFNLKIINEDVSKHFSIEENC